MYLLLIGFIIAIKREGETATLLLEVYNIFYNLLFIHTPVIENCHIIARGLLTTDATGSCTPDITQRKKSRQ